jgi:gliding motility-associated-like protein
VSVITTTDVSALKATELFTPNNDGLNDAFVIGYVNLDKENQLKIFDRNGQELFTKNNYKNDWQGELSNGKTAENGIYYYVFTENDGDKTRELKGSVELKR